MEQNYVYDEMNQVPDKANGLSIAGLVFGIIGIVLSCCVGGCGTIFGVVGLVLSILGNNKNKTKLGTAALIVSIIGTVIGVIMLIIGIVMSASGVTDSIMQQYMDMLS